MKMLNRAMFVAALGLVLNDAGASMKRPFDDGSKAQNGGANSSKVINWQAIYSTELTNWQAVGSDELKKMIEEANRRSEEAKKERERKLMEASLDRVIAKVIADEAKKASDSKTEEQNPEEKAAERGK